MFTESNLLDLTKKKFEIWETLNMEHLSQIFDDKGLMFNTYGKVNTKEELIEKIRSEECLLKGIDFQNTVARVYGTSAVVQGEGSFTFSIKGQIHSKILNFLDVWIKREEGWKLVSTHYNQSA